MPLALKSTSTATNKVEYTTKEINLAAQVIACCLVLAEQPVKKPVEIDPEVQQIVSELAEKGEHDGIDTLARAAFRTHVRNAHVVGEEFVGTDEFPKMRDPTSMQLIMRKGLDLLDRSDLKDTIFATYGAKKVVAKK